MEKLTTPIAVAALVGVFASIVTHRLLNLSSKEVKDDDSSSAKSLLELIQRRRSIFPKQYSSKPVARKILEEMLEAARWAPTHRLTEPWEFIVFESPDARKQLVRRQETKRNVCPVIS
jgi:hypothetical protein